MATNIENTFSAHLAKEIQKEIDQECLNTFINSRDISAEYAVYQKHRLYFIGIGIVSIIFLLIFGLLLIPAYPLLLAIIGSLILGLTIFSIIAIVKLNRKMIGLIMEAI